MNKYSAVKKGVPKYAYKDRQQFTDVTRYTFTSFKLPSKPLIATKVSIMFRC